MRNTNTEAIAFRDAPTAADVKNVGQLVADTGFFRQDEVEVAKELVEERLAKGMDSGYYFWFADSGDELAGYVCYGPTPCTVGTFDLYWIVVGPAHQGTGLGRKLSALAEESARKMGGRRIYVETAGKDQYKSTREFYSRVGFIQTAVLPDFYDIGDAKVIYQKNLR